MSMSALNRVLISNGTIATVISLAILTSTPCRAQVAANPKLPGRVKTGAPVAFLAPMQEYDEKPLKHPVASCLTLARALHQNGFQITLATDAKSLATVEADLKTHKWKATVHEVANAEALTKEFHRWTDESFAAAAAIKAPFGVVVLSGHGEMRRGAGTEWQDHFLTTADAPGRGGVNVYNLRLDAGLKELPIVLVVDACRSGMPGDDGVAWPGLAPGATKSGGLVAQGQGNRFGISKGVEGDGGVIFPTTYWATHKGMIAIDDQDDVVATLAEGLKIVPDKDRYLARDRRPPLKRFVPPIEGDKDLALRSWFIYAITEQAARTENSVVGYVELGSVDQSMLLASRVQGRLARQGRPAVELLDGWSKPAGDFVVERSTAGVRIVRPVAMSGTSLYANGLLKGEYEPAGRTLLVELVAHAASPDANVVTPAGTLSLLIQPSNTGQQNEPLPVTYFSTVWNKARKIPWNRPVVVPVTLDSTPQGKKLTSVAFSADPASLGTWPAGAAITVTRMALVENEVVSEIKTPETEIDLTPRWWVSDLLRDDGSKAIAQLRFERSPPVLNLSVTGADAGKQAGRGGAVYPPVFVDKSTHRTELRLTGAGAKGNTQFTVSLLAGTKFVGMKQFNLKSTDLTAPIYFDFDDSGFVDYLGVTVENGTMKIVKLSIVAKAAQKK